MLLSNLWPGDDQLEKMLGWVDACSTFPSLFFFFHSEHSIVISNEVFILYS